jgi:tRNA uridine 5-carboxymethylaminomethyl modification enzyme
VDLSFDVVVIGGGHAGTEAAHAAAMVLRAHGGGRVALVTMDAARIGAMSCNPAIGGLAKGQMVREIDALGGLMGRATDATGIMFKMLNTSKGAAVRGPRAQCDKHAYAAEVQRLVACDPEICVIEGTVDAFDVVDGVIAGAVLAPGACMVVADPQAIEANAAGDRLARAPFGEGARRTPRMDGPSTLRCTTCVLTTGTFMRALMHTGQEKVVGGRIGEGAAVPVSATLRSLGFELGRLKTGTPPRLERGSIDWESLPPQLGDERPEPFSDTTDRSRFPVLRQVECRATQTTPWMHRLIRDNLHLAPMYAGEVEAECGPRYCPSLEDKVVRFADRDSHHVFLEPESLHTAEVYCNGLSTSLPAAVQEQIVRGLEGCARATILKFGYAVEYDMVWPHQIDATGETKLVAGLFLAGQINGTSGYEEAGAQGLLAGLNAARRARGADVVRLGREQAYIGVMMDDLVTKVPREPYRMFTSRAEHRLLLRADNAADRLTRDARAWGLIADGQWRAFEVAQAALAAVRARLDPKTASGRALRPVALDPSTSDQAFAGALGIEDVALAGKAMTEVRYEGYITRMHSDIRRAQDHERVSVPLDLDPAGVTGLRGEAIEVLRKFRPATLGQAGRLAGINPADVSLLAIAIKRHRAGTR